jgi:4-oxalomesaconate tautomerase
MQIAIPCLFMRRGTSRWPFFPESDLPAEVMVRDRVLFADADVLCHQDLT